MTVNSETSAASARLLNVLTQPLKQSRIKSWTVLSGMVLLIGIWDYLTGSVYSLSPLYLVPVSLTVLCHGANAGRMVASVCFVTRIAGDLVTQSGSIAPNTIWNVVGMLVIHLFVIGLIQSLLGLHRQLEEKIAVQSGALRESAADRERLEMEILDVAARERSAFGRELHDELAQHFVATALAAQTLAEKLGGREGTSEARAIVRWIEEGIAKARKLARGLLLARIEPARFPQELAELAIAASRGQVQCRLRQQGREIEADASRCAQLFRSAQEAVGNALRHARPRTIQITLANDEQGLCVTVEDDGCGLPERMPATEGLGLRIMQHRARIIGATLNVRSARAQGTRVVCRLPRDKFFPA
jgi:signal transduction histidine kinase